MVSDTRAAARIDGARHPARFVLLAVPAGVVLTGWPGWASAAAFSGFFLGEGLYFLLRAESPTRLPVVALDMSLGIILPVLLRARRGDQLRCYGLTPVAAAAVMSGLWLLPNLFGIVLA